MSAFGFLLCEKKIVCEISFVYKWGELDKAQEQMQWMKDIDLKYMEVFLINKLLGFSSCNSYNYI